MSSQNPNSRTALCTFTFADGRHCRSLREDSSGTSSTLCPDHAQKQAHSQAAAKLTEDLSFFFSGDYLSANDLNAALSRIFIGVASGNLKPRAARTLAYLAQTMLQTLRLAQHEFISACGESDWHDSVISSLNENSNYAHPKPQPPKPTSPSGSPSTSPSSTPSAPPESTPPPTPPQTPRSSAPPTAPPTLTATPPPTAARLTSSPPTRTPAPSATAPPTLTATPRNPQTTPATPTPPPTLAPPPSSASSPTPIPAATRSTQPLQLRHPERSEGSRQVASAPLTQKTAPSPTQPPPSPQLTAPSACIPPAPATSPTLPTPPRRQHTPPRDPYAVHFGPECRVRIDGKAVDGKP